MIPYADFLYFGVLLYVVVPTLVLGLCGRASGRWILIATAAMLVVQYGGSIHISAGIEVREIWLVAGYALLQWAVALGFLQSRGRTSRRAPFYAAILLSVSPLAVAKYVPLVAPHCQFGFLGISYVTFRSLDVIICVQDRLLTSLPAWQFLAYLFFFGTVSSGPIDRYRRFAADWQRRRTRAEFLQDLDGAAHRIVTGFFYKFIVAALVKQHWLDPVTARDGALSMLSYMYAYSFYLFFDFAGYSAFAIGVSYLFGIHTPENFNRPFLAANIRDFWNRWHITLSWWLRDHVYMRFVMAATKGRWFRSRYLASYLGLFLAFGLMGLWHGTAPHYVLYGLYHGALLSAHEAFARWNKQRKLWGEGTLWRLAGTFGTFNCVCFGFLLFSGHLTAATGSGGAGMADAHAYDGRFEQASCDEIGGWAWDSRNPQASVSVDIYADDTLLGTVPADLFRPDLATAGKGTGAHAFIYVLPNRVKDARPHQTSVRISGTTIALGDGPRTVVCVMGVKGLDGYAGAHDGADCQRISGWAWDATRPDAAVAVDVYDDTTLLATVPADQFRGELRDAGYGNGAHGFTYAPPSQLRDGRPHAVVVHISGSNVPLLHTPRRLTCPEPSAQALATPAPTPTPGPTPASGLDRILPPGTVRSYTDNRDGTVSDLGTGLMWEKKIQLDERVDAANLHDADNCYPWGGTCATGDAACAIDADCGGNGPCTAEDCQAAAPDGLTIFKWIERLNAVGFAGHSDWRMPTAQELYSIVNPLEDGDPATRATFNGSSCGSACDDVRDPACSCTQSGLYWAASKFAPGPDESWMMLFYCNGNLFLDLKSNRFYVRAVRSGP